MRSLSFTVFGAAQPQGSKRAVPLRRGQRFAQVVDANPATKEWRGLVAQVAAEAAEKAGWGMARGACVLTISVLFPRPKGHYGKRGLLPSAPDCHTKKPDTLKLGRAVEDSLTGVVYLDDSQVVEHHLEKGYGEPARVVVTVTALED